MKNFSAYFHETNKVYEFRIKMAHVEPKGEVLERIKNALNCFQVETISAVKRLPITEHWEFAKEGARLLSEGAQFDFSEFSKVVEGKPGPMVEKMKKMIGVYLGKENAYFDGVEVINVLQFLKNLHSGFTER